MQARYFKYRRFQNIYHKQNRNSQHFLQRAEQKNRLHSVQEVYTKALYSLDALLPKRTQLYRI